MATQKLEEVLSKDKFNIPKYQRDYAWGKHNFIDLWEDLKEALDSNDTQGHFLGTIVVAKNPHNPAIYDLIDGQQRITTTFMLLYALICKSEYKDNLKIKFLLDKKGELKLELAPQNRDFFKELLKQAEIKQVDEKCEINTALEDQADTRGKKRLYEVFEAILDEVAKLEKEEIEDHIETLTNMVLMWLEESNSGKAIRTFQSVNDRGVPLNILDKLKSLLIYYSNRYCDGDKNDLDEFINVEFGEIFKTFLQIEEHKYISNIGNHQLNEADIFRYHAGSIEFEAVKSLGHYRNSNEDTYKKLKESLKSLA